MKRIYQTTGADRSQNGNCFQACMASFLDTSLNDVPNFQAGAENGKLLPVQARRAMDLWLEPFGLGYVEFAFLASTYGQSHSSPADFILGLSEEFGSNFYLLTGRTRNNRTHTVVCCRGVVWHDPATEVGSTVLVGPCTDGYYRIGVFLAISKPT